MECPEGRPRKVHVEFPGVLVFGLKIFKGCNLISLNFQGWGYVLPEISRGTDKTKNL